MQGIVVTKQESVSQLNPRGTTDEFIRVTFTVDGDGPFYRTFPRDGFTGFSARAELEAFAREVRALRGQS
jgi:hypothetical protein